MVASKKTRAFTQALAIAALTGCASPRWQVVQSEYSYQAAEEDGHYFTQNSILVDTRTGKTWILSPSDEDDPAGYEWVPMRKSGAHGGGIHPAAPARSLSASPRRLQASRAPLGQ